MSQLISNISKKYIAQNIAQIRWHSSIEKNMRVWSAMEYGGPEKLSLDVLPVPTVTSPDDVIVKVNATSVNPIDVRMLGG